MKLLETARRACDVARGFVNHAGPHRPSWDPDVDDNAYTAGAALAESLIEVVGSVDLFITVLRLTVTGVLR